MRSLCDNGKLFDSKFKNALDMTAYGDIEGCRDMSHLQNHEGIVCPRGFFQCNEGHCVPPRLVCDGTKHCVEGDDELNCGKTNVLNNVTH